MSQELFYTSAPRGLQAGKSGFCTVAATRQMGAALMERLESLSSYRPLFPPHHPQAALNPVTHSYLRISVGGRSYSLLSRIGAAGLDYSGRTNLFAHHIVLDLAEQSAGGPAWLLQQDALRLNGDWQGEPRYLEPRTLPRGDVVVGPCREWKRTMGDAGWGGELAERFEKAPSEVVYLIFEPGFDPLPLLAESLMLLPPQRRWDVTFSTYYTALPPGVPCVWRCVANGSEEAKKVARLPGTINLCVPAGPASGGDRVEQARTGKAPRRQAPVAVKHLPSSPLPHPVRLPEPMPEEKVAFQPERPRSRVWPFLVGMLAGIILTACVSGVAGYFFAVQPLLTAEKKSEELHGEIQKRDGEIQKKDGEIQRTKEQIINKDKQIGEEQRRLERAFAERENEWFKLRSKLLKIVTPSTSVIGYVTLSLQNQPFAAVRCYSLTMMNDPKHGTDVLLATLTDKIKEVRKEKDDTQLKQLLSSGTILGQPFTVKDMKADTPEEMKDQFLKEAEEVARAELKKKEEQNERYNGVIKAMVKINKDVFDNVSLENAVKIAKNESDSKKREDTLTEAIVKSYMQLFEFGDRKVWDNLSNCEEKFHTKNIEGLKDDYDKIFGVNSTPRRYKKFINQRRTEIERIDKEQPNKK